VIPISVISVFAKLPDWVTEGGREYEKRLKSYCKLSFIDCPLPKRSAASDILRIKQQEAAVIRARIPAGAAVIALDERGVRWDSEVFANKIETYQSAGQPICFVIGGPDGLDDAIRQSADVVLSLSNLTFPHALVRVILTEQLYRAFTILHEHPYHRR